LLSIRGQDLSQQSNTHRQALKKAALYYGIYSRVARDLGVTPSVVRRVALEKAKSARISAALVAEVLRVERAASAA
jgi:hypothetical protein